MATKQQLINRVLFLTGAKGAGQTAAAEDVAEVEEVLPGKLDELAKRKIVYVPDADDFDDALLEWLAILLANSVGPAFGSAMDAGAIALAESRLRAMQTQPTPSNPARVEYF